MTEPENSVDDKIDAALLAQQQEERDEDLADFDRLAQSTERIADALARDGERNAAGEDSQSET